MLFLSIGSPLAANLEGVGNNLIEVSGKLKRGIDKGETFALLLNLVDASTELQESINKFKSAFGIENKSRQLTERLQPTNPGLSQAI